MTVKVQYVGSLQKLAEVCALSGVGVFAEGAVVEMQPFNVDSERVETIDVSRFFTDGGYEHRRRKDGLSFVTINNHLAVLNHYGLEADYSKEFVGTLWYHFTEILLYSFLEQKGETGGRRFFNNRSYDRVQFCDAIDNMFARYGFLP